MSRSSNRSTRASQLSSAHVMPAPAQPLLIDVDEDHRIGSGRQEPQPQELLTCEQVFRALAGHRYEILTVLALKDHLSVSAMSRQLNLSAPVVSRDLNRLQKHVLVEWLPDKWEHLFRLTKRVHASCRNGAVQFCIAMPNGDWVLINREEFAENGQSVPCPTTFLDPSRMHPPASGTTTQQCKQGHRDSRASARRHDPDAIAPGAQKHQESQRGRVRKKRR